MDALIIILVLASAGVVYLVNMMYVKGKEKNPEQKHFDHFW